MDCRTDIALERQEIQGENCEGVIVKKKKIGTAEITEVNIINVQGEKNLGKPIGKYITIDLPEFSHESELLDGRLKALVESLKSILPTIIDKALVVGLGNDNITPDALGPLCAEQIFSTRHIDKDFSDYLGVKKIISVSSVSTGVLGQTGIESAEYIKGIAEFVKPDVVIVIDALASRRLSRLGKTVQISNVGITPGSGVGNHRKSIDKELLGIPVIAVGVPTVVDANTIVKDLSGKNAKDDVTEVMMVTPKDIDTVITRAARLLSLSINCALQPELNPDFFLAIS